MVLIGLDRHMSPATRAGFNLTVKRFAGLPYRHLFRKSWSFSESEFWKYQNARLSEIYNDARLEVPHYRDNPISYPDLESVSLPERLRVLPILEKREVKSAIDDFRMEKPLPFTSYHTTSGTSGSPVRLAASLPERSFSQAALESWYERLCGKRHPRTLFLSGFMTPTPGDDRLFWRDRVTGATYLSIYSMNQANREVISQLLMLADPDLIYGYASAVHQLALLFRDNPAFGWKNRIAVVTSEVLEPHWRELIEQVICRRVFNLYSSQEGSHCVQECPEGSLHINPLIGIVEIVDQNGAPVPNGSMGEVVITSLRRRSMPLIRYRLGDSAVSTGYSAACSCGLMWPTIGEIQGRSEDLVRARDGRSIGYLCFHATKNLSGIKEAQLLQLGFEQFLFRIVPSETEAFARETVEALTRGEIEKRIKYPVSLSFEYLDAVPRGANGKFKAVVVETFS